MRSCACSQSSIASGVTRTAPHSGGHGGGASMVRIRCACRARSGSMLSIGSPWRETSVCTRWASWRAEKSSRGELALGDHGTPRDVHLTAHGGPVEQQRDVRVGLDLARLARPQGSGEHECVALHTLENHRPRGRTSAVADRDERDRPGSATPASVASLSHSSKSARGRRPICGCGSGERSVTAETSLPAGAARQGSRSLGHWIASLAQSASGWTVL